MWPLVLLMLPVAWAQDTLAGAERLIAGGEYQRALQILRQNPISSPRWHVLASKAYDGINDPARAVAEAEAALRLDPRHEPAHLQLGQVFLSRNTPAAAEEIFREALLLFPESFLIRLGRGLALKELQRYDEAAKDLEICLAQQPSSGIAFDALATTYLHGAASQRLLKVAEAYVQRNPSDYRGYYYLAAARDALGLPEEATLDLLRRSLARNPNFAASHGLMGKLLLKKGALAEAAAALERAIKLRPDHIPSHMSLANTYRRMGRGNDAAREFQRVRELQEAQRQPRPSLRYHRGSR